MEKKVTKKKFVIPTIKEVEDYMLMKKPEWPLLFIEHYAAQFWNHYESCGWRLAGGNAIKNWQACFNSQWQEVKYGSVQILQKFKMQQVPEKKVFIQSKNGVFTVEHMNGVLADFMKNYDKIPDETLALYYDWMKAKSYIKLSQEELTGFIAKYHDDKQGGRAACVRASLNKMITYQIRFK